MLEVSELCYLPDAEPFGSEGKTQIRQVSADLEVLCEGTASDGGYLGLKAKDCLKSRVWGNRTYGFVRGNSTLPSHNNKNN